MSLSPGLFDVFTYTIPGSLYLSLVVYVADRFGWLDLAQLKNVPTIILTGGILVASYVLGFIADPVAAELDRRMRFWKAIFENNTRDLFVSRVPGAANRAFVDSDLHFLLAAVEMNDKDAALEISRLRAVGLMLRNCSAAFLAACIVSIVEAAAGNHVPAAILCSILFAAAMFSGIRQGKRLRAWAKMKTLEICYWIPGIDESVQADRALPKPSDRQRANESS